jgi:hypothetical protein
MKSCSVLSMLLFSCCTIHAAQTGALPHIEQGIYQPTQPFENIKQKFYVRERERSSLPMVHAASTSISRFLISAVNPTNIPDAPIANVLPEAEHLLRLPPPASQSTGRYVPTSVYCWKSGDQNHLEFLIDWGDITTKARYTDSYVFTQHGQDWYFEKHGSVAPRSWVQTERYFQRKCPDE